MQATSNAVMQTLLADFSVRRVLNFHDRKSNNYATFAGPKWRRPSDLIDWEPPNESLVDMTALLHY
jgi:hypothetical protein